MSSAACHLNVLTDPVFPIRAASGVRRWVAFRDLLDEADDYPVAFDWPRADFNIATAELAIGLLALIYRLTEDAEWRALWDGRSEVDLDAEIERLKPCFHLFGGGDGSGPRFAQDYEALVGEDNAVEALLIDSPGVNGQKKNSDLMTHRERFPALGLKAAATALYCLQQFAPSGGAGNRTSMRGGGPMTVLVLPVGRDDAPASLWRMLLINLPVQFGGVNWLEDHDIGRALPWMQPTRTSEGNVEIAEADAAVHPVQAFFGMPRRIRLVTAGEGLCPLTGEIGPLVTGFVQKPWGINYSVWRHPLTPYRQMNDEAPYTVKPKPRRFGYRDWVGVTMGRDERASKAFPSANVTALRSRVRALEAAGIVSQRVLAAGWAMSNMEAETYLFSVQPLHLPAEGRSDVAEALARTAGLYLQAAEGAVRLLCLSLKHALFGKEAKVKDGGVFDEATDAFFERTEAPFHAALARIAAADLPEPGTDDRETAWLDRLRTTALIIFDAHATVRLEDGMDIRLSERITDAYGALSAGLSRTSKLASELGVLQPTKKVAPKQPRKSTRTTARGDER